MASTYENDLRLQEIGTGEQSGTWGTTTNTNLELIGEALSYSATGEAIANASTHTITVADGVADEARCFYLKCTGGGQACTVTLAPNSLSKVWVIENTTSYTLTFSQGSGANVAILAGQVKMIATDGAGSGAAIYDLMQDLAVPDLFVDDDLTLQSDAAVLGFGADKDTTLTHVADTGLLLNSTRQLQFGDSGTYIHQSADGVLDLVSDTEIEINATTVDLNGNLDVSGTYTGGGLMTTGGNIVIPDAGNIGSASDTNAIAIGADGDVTLTQDLELQHDAATLSFGADNDVILTHVADTGLLLNSTMQLQFNDASQYINAPSATVLDINATDEIELNATLIDVNGNLDVSGTSQLTGVVTFTATPVFSSDITIEDDLFLDSDAAVIHLGEDGDVTLTHVADTGILLNSTMQLQFNDASQYINAPSATVLDINATDEVELNATLVDINANLEVSGTAAITGIATFTDDIIIGDGKTIGSASDVDAMTIASNGQVTFTQTLIGTALDISGDIDVDGTTNLDVVDIDGAVDMATTLAVAGNVDFNGDLDVDGTTNLDVTNIVGDLTVDSDTITFQSANVDDPLLYLKQTGNNASSARIYFVKDKGAAGADNDEIGKIQFIADNDAQEQTSFVKQIATIADASNGAEGGKFQIQIASHDGELVDGLVLTDGDAEDEIDVTIGSGTSSVTTVAGDLSVISNVGIGDSSPTELLEIAGSSDPTLLIRHNTADNANSGKISFRENAGGTTGADLRYDGSANNFIIDTSDASNALVIKRTTGNVGIGGEPVATASAYDGASLHLRQEGSSKGSQIHLTNAATGDAAGNGAHISMWHDDDLYITNQESDGNIKFASGGNSDVLVINDSGNATFAGTALVTGVLTTTAATVFNGGFAANDGSTITTADNTTQLTLSSTDADATVGPVLDLFRNSATPANFDPMGKISFSGEDADGNKTEYVHQIAYPHVVTAGSESGYWELHSLVGAADKVRITVDKDAVIINESGFDTDFRVESNDSMKMLFVDGGNNGVLIESSGADIRPYTTLDVVGQSNTEMMIHNDTDTAGQHAALFFKSDSQNESGGARSRTKAGIFFVRDDPGTRGTGKLHIAIDGGNDDTNVAVGDAAISITADGEVTMPKTPAFLARPASNQNDIATDTDVTIVLGTEVFDQNADFASNLFTAPVAGRYQISFSANLRNVDSAADYYEVQIVTSNRNYNFIQDPNYGQDSVYFSISGSALCDMDASDTARFKIVQAGGTAQTDISTESHFSGYLAC